MSVDLQRQMDTATAFFLAGERCSLDLEFGYYGQHSMAAPTITNYALSVELALKILHYIAFDKNITGHSLKSLYSGLPTSIKSNILYLEDCVSYIDDYFVDWRYPFEKEFLVGDFSNPRRSFIVCYQEIRRLQPQLVSIYEKNWGQFLPDFMNAWGENVALEIVELS